MKRVYGPIIRLCAGVLHSASKEKKTVLKKTKRAQELQKQKSLISERGEGEINKEKWNRKRERRKRRKSLWVNSLHIARSGGQLIMPLILSQGRRMQDGLFR